METAGKLVVDEQLKEALKERGLGTPATRASIIETLLDRGYITRDKKSLAATDLGRYLVAIVQNRSLKSPELTGDWEAKLRQVERGRFGAREFMAEIVRYTGDVIHSDDAAAIDRTRLGDCPRCGRPVIAGKRGYGCSGWRDGCPFVLWREYRGPPAYRGPGSRAAPAPAARALVARRRGTGRRPSHGRRRSDRNPDSCRWRA